MSFSQVLSAPSNATGQALLSRHQTVNSSTAPQSVVEAELSIWLAALPSYFDLKNHPLDDDERAQLSTRNFAPETRILQQALRRCLHLCLLHSHEFSTANVVASEHLVNAGDELDFAGMRAARLQSNPHVRAWETLSELYLHCRALTQTRSVDLGAWTGLSSIAARAMLRLNALPNSFNVQPARSLACRLPRIHDLFLLTDAGDSIAVVATVLSSFALCLEQLGFVGEWLAKDRPMKLTLPLFAHLRATARAAAASLEGLARRAAEKNDELFELYDSAAYAVKMELNKVFNHELVGLASASLAPTIYTRVENAQGLLRDCFQQMIVTLAQPFDPSLDAASLFETQIAKLQNSLRLREELWMLSELVRRAERDGGRRPLAPLVARLHDFQQGAMRHLMYKDWESFERFVAEIGAARGAVELGPVLHRFATYLDALFNQINMRAALADQPFTPTLLSD